MIAKALKTWLVITVLCMGFAPNGFCQDIQLSQYYNVSPLMNPAFAGTSYAYRAIASSRIQWNGLDAKYNSYIASVDYNAAKLNSGLGAFLVHDQQGDGSVVRSEFAIQYAYAIPLKKEVSLRLALQTSINQREIGREFSFPNQFNGSGFDPSLPTNDQAALTNTMYPDFSTGLLFYTPKLWAGLSGFHLNKPDQSVTGEGDKIDRSFYLIGGYKFDLRGLPIMGKLANRHYEGISITPTFQYKTQGKSDQMDLGVYANYSTLMLGVWYRGLPLKNADSNILNSESVVFLMSLRLDQFSVGYSFDNVVSDLSGLARGAHEISVVFQWPKNVEKSKPQKFLPCPVHIR